MTKQLRGVVLASVVALVCCFGASTARADDWNRRTILTIDQPMMVPGATLAPGTYTFILGNPETSRDHVYVLRQDGTPVASARVTHWQRGNEQSDLAIAVALNENGAMPVMKGWFFPGLMDGYEFVYPAEQSRTIARAETVVIPVSLRG
jgi:hypothetical protein